MTKAQFDHIVVTHYETLLAQARARGDDWEDALHDGLVSLYRSRYYRGLPTKGTAQGRGLLIRALHLARLHETSRRKQEPADPGRGEVDMQYELVADVRKALGRLSLYHYNLVQAILIEGHALREVAARTGESFYRVFTELEIAKAYLRTELQEYRS